MIYPVNPGIADAKLAKQFNTFVLMKYLTHGISLMILFSLSKMIFLTGCTLTNTSASQPNIIFIMIADLGYGDLGCYGSQFNQTPIIDNLAAKGLKFTDFHSNGPMCTPTRAAFMTGMYQYRLGPLFEGPLSGVEDFDTGMPLKL